MALGGEAQQRLEAMARKQEAERKENERQIGKQVSDYKAAVMSGSPWSGNLAQLGARVRNTEHEADFIQVQRNASELFVFNAMSPSQQEEYLRKKAQAPKSGEEAKFLAT